MITVKTRYGSIQGNIRRFDDLNRPILAVEKVLGIPYALPPVGELRFKPPRPPQPRKPAIYEGANGGTYCSYQLTTNFSTNCQLTTNFS